MFFFVAFQSVPICSLVGLVVLVYFLYSFLLDEVSHRSAIHDFHQVGFKIVEGETKIEILLWVFPDALHKITPPVLEDGDELSLVFVFFVVVDGVGLVLFEES